jgi:hypothetical protein
MKAKPTIAKNASGSILPTTSTMPVRAPLFTPIRFSQVSTSRQAVTTIMRVTPPAAAGHSGASASASALASAAAVDTRVSQVIQPISKPTKPPKASRV